jgi:thioredoxin 1
MSAAKNVTTASFQADVLQNAKPVLVDFWAEWCGPCRQVSPILDQIAAEYADKIEIVKVNVDNEQQLAMQYGVVSIPALQVFKGGELVKSMVGAKPKNILVNELSEFLA